jgi:hypothetical protein
MLSKLKVTPSRPGNQTDIDERTAAASRRAEPTRKAIREAEQISYPFSRRSKMKEEDDEAKLLQIGNSGYKRKLVQSATV